jgi:hypothetical protein
LKYQVIDVAEAKPCVMCGKLTTRVLFGDSSVGICICSRKCRMEYFETLRHRKKEQQNLLRYLDGKMARTKKYGRIGWASAGIGVVWMMLGVFLIRLSVTKNLDVGAKFFIIGVFVATCGALSTCFFADRIRKLTETRGKLA